MFGRKVKMPEVSVPDVRLRDVKLPDVRIPEVRLPEMHLPEVRLPDVRLPDVHLPEVHIPSRVDIPELHVPSLSVGGGRLAGFNVPELRTPDLRTPELEILARNGLMIRRKRANPIWTGLKFVAGAGLGLAVGCLLAALLAPAAGEDTRNKLMGMLPSGGSGGAEPKPSSNSTESKGRIQTALEAARRQRELKERELMAEFETAKRTGTAP